ncbi:Bax inhibitor-1/YccA family protein [Endothiovibrio diazotrophicus]
MEIRTATRTAGRVGVISAEASKVLRNTYMLLAMTLLFSAATAGAAIVTNTPPLHWLITLGGYFGLLFLTTALRNSAWGLLSVFALTGFMGFTLGPIVNHYLHLPGGSEIVMTAMGGTALIFAGLSAVVLTTGRDFSFMGKTLMIGILVAFVLGIGAVVFEMPMLSLAVSAMFVVLMSAMILYETSNIIHGGETNYIMATITLYVAIYNLFLSLLQLLGVFGGDD